MARGHQKIQSQQKNAKKAAEAKKAKGHDQKTAAKAALVFTCGVCKSQMPDPKTFKQHFESKHPKVPLPPELVDVEAWSGQGGLGVGVGVGVRVCLSVCVCETECVHMHVRVCVCV